MSTNTQNLKHEFGKAFLLIKEKSSQHPYITKSLILHLFLIILATGMLPRCSRDIEKPKIIAIDIMPLGAAPKSTPPAPKIEKPVEKPVEKPTPPPPVPPKDVKKPVEAQKMEKAEKIPSPKPIEKKPAPKKADIEKKPEPEKKPEDEKKKDDKDQEGKKKLLKDLEKKDQADLADIIDKADKDAPKAPLSQQKAEASGKSEVVDPAFINELMGKIQSQVSQCWNIPIGAKDVQDMKVKLFIALNPKGIVTDVKIIDQAIYATDNTYRVVADSAVWAVKECSPLHDLPAEKYDLWKEIEFTFDPSMAL